MHAAKWSAVAEISGHRKNAIEMQAATHAIVGLGRVLS